MSSSSRTWLVSAVVTLVLTAGAVPEAAATIRMPAGSSPALATAGADAQRAAGTVPEAESTALDEVDPQGRAEPEVVEPATDEEARASGPADPVIAVLGEAGAGAGAVDHVIVGLTAPLETTASDVTVIGASWDPTPAKVRVDVRVARAGSWGEWEALAVDDQREGDAGRPGTEPFVLTEGEDVQVRLMTDDGSSPANARLDAFGLDVTPADVRAAQQVTGFGSGLRVPASRVSVATSDGISAPQPTISLRESWGARAPSGPLDIGEVRGITVHHTAGSNTYTPANVPAILRGIQNYHMQSRGWSDIGYNFLIDQFGGTWEGRSGGILNTTRGVHASSFNSVTSGVSVMGNFETVGVNTAARNALASFIAWKLALHGVGAAGHMTVNGVKYPVIVGHRDVPDAATACPGRNLYALLPTIRTLAVQRQNFPRGIINHDFNGDSVPDILAPSGDGTPYLGTGDPFAPRVGIGHGWGGMDLIVGSPALAGGNRVDLIAREAATGRLYVYHGNGHGGFAGRTSWGLGWNSMSAVIAPGDWNGDGRSDLIAVHRVTGNLYLYRGNGAGGVSAAVQIGHGWGGIRSVVAAGDMTGDGKMDLVAIVDSTGELRVYPGNGRGGFRPAQSMGMGLEDYDVAVGIGDVTGDGLRDVLARNSVTGEMATVAGNGRGGRAGIRTWGSDWDTRGALVGAQNWNGNGRPVLITFDRSTELLYSYEAASVVSFPAAETAGLLAGATAYAVVGDVTESGAASVVTRNAGGILYLHEARGDGTFAPAREIGHGWNGMQQLNTAGDFDHDGIPDLLALSSSGVLYVYPFDPGASGALAEQFVIGSGFANYRVFGVGGWSRSTSADILAINRFTGQLLWFVGHGRGGLTGGAVIGTGWGNYDVVALGDVFGSGNNDLLARNVSTGAYAVYAANGTGGFGPRWSVSGVPPFIGGLP